METLGNLPQDVLAKIMAYITDTSSLSALRTTSHAMIRIPNELIQMATHQNRNPYPCPQYYCPRCHVKGRCNEYIKEYCGKKSVEKQRRIACGACYYKFKCFLRE